ncbi:MAG: hypothetical protein MJ181_00190 [Treponema sp.]|nr:hypothetical protein [Treponema sp.]
MKKIVSMLAAFAMAAALLVSCSNGSTTPKSEPEAPAVNATTYVSSSQWAEIGFDVTGLKSLNVEFAEIPANVQFKTYEPENYPQIAAKSAVCENPDGNTKITIQNKGVSATVKIVKVTGTKADGSEVPMEIDLTQNGSWGWEKQ